MAFDPVVYMEWAKLKSGARLNLSRSGMPLLSREEIPVSFDGVDINGEHPYGYPPLLEAIAARYGTDPAAVVPSLGMSQAIFIVCAALLERGDIVAVEKPAYEPFLSCARAVGADVRRFERRFENGYGVDLDDFASVVPDGTKLVLMTNLHNPSGVFLDRPDIRRMAGLARRKGGFLFIDEIYLDYMSGDEAQTAFGLEDNVCVGSSLTKVYGLPGFRCGWILAPSSLAVKMRRVLDHLHVEHVYLAEQLATQAFAHLEALKARTRAMRDENREMVIRFMANERRLDWVEPRAGIVGFPRVIGRAGGGDALARTLRERYETSVVPGSFFEEPAHFRLGFGIAPDVLRQGLENISRALSEL